MRPASPRSRQPRCKETCEHPEFLHLNSMTTDAAAYQIHRHEDGFNRTASAPRCRAELRRGHHLAPHIFAVALFLDFFQASICAQQFQTNNNTNLSTNFSSIYVGGSANLVSSNLTRRTHSSVVDFRTQFLLVPAALFWVAAQIMSSAIFRETL